MNKRTEQASDASDPSDERESDLPGRTDLLSLLIQHCSCPIRAQHQLLSVIEHDCAVILNMVRTALDTTAKKC